MKTEKKDQRKENPVLIFAGTTEGRVLAEYAAEKNIPCYVSTATEYGKSLLDDLEGIEKISGRMDEGQIERFITEKKIPLVIDATHPFAVLATGNIRQACLRAGAEYIRCLRDEGQEKPAGSAPEVKVTGSVKEAVDFLKGTDGNILIATGSKELKLYTAIPDYKKRCFARVLSTKEAVEESVKLGFTGKNLIAMQGPFSSELNLALLRQVNARYFVTKESGTAGGFYEKLDAAGKAGAVLVVVGRPKEEGESVAEVKRRMDVAGARYFDRKRVRYSADDTS